MKLIFVLIVVMAMIFGFAGGCASDKVIDGKKYETYGLFNKDNVEDKCIKYEASVISAIAGVVFFEVFLIPPLYVFGFSLWEPVEKIENCDNKDF